MAEAEKRPPKLSDDQIRELLMLGRRVLRGEHFKVFTDREDRLCYRPVEEGELTRVE